MATDWLEIYSSGRNLIVLGQWHHFLDRKLWQEPHPSSTTLDMTSTVSSLEQATTILTSINIATC